jgi:hypothetical protein
MATCPDGREVIADYRQPVVHVIRRATSRNDPADWVTLGRWLDSHAKQACTSEQIRDDTCTHPPASPEPFTPPKYREQPASTLF